MINQVLLYGEVMPTPPVSIRQNNKGEAVISFGMKTWQRDVKDKLTETFHVVSAFGVRAERAADYIKEGRRFVVVSGRLNYYTTGSGEHKAEVVADKIQFHPSPQLPAVNS